MTLRGAQWLLLILLATAGGPAGAAPTERQTAADIARRSFGGSQAMAIARRSMAATATPRSRIVMQPAPAAPQRATRPQLDTATLQRTDRYRGLIEHHSRLNHVDADLVQAVIYAESGGDAGAVSAAGAQGLMQLMPATARGLGVTDPLNPEQSIASGVHYLRDLLDRFGSTELALWAYNAGPGSVQRGVLPSETEAYVPQVLFVRRALLARADNREQLR